MAESTARHRSPRFPAYLHTALTLAVVLIFVALLTTAPQSSPPAIAEIAPAAVEQIKLAPTEQSSDFGSAKGGSGGKPGPGGVGVGGKGKGPGGKPVAAPEGKEVPSTFRCVGNPPRQIEDPQSPPCVPYYDPKSNNGGVTSRGVSKDEIIIAKPFGGIGAAGIPGPYVDFINSRFQLYGRHLKVVEGNSRLECTPEEQKAIAAKVDTQIKPFASIFFYGCGGAVYNREMARRNIITVAADSNLTEADLTELRPYAWQYPMARDRLFAQYGEWMCNRLKGQLATHAGSLGTRDLRKESRKFGLVISQYDLLPYSIDPEALKQEFAACGGEFAVETPLEEPYFQRRTSSKLKAEGVTTVVCLCGYSEYGNLVNESTANAYSPEWLIGSFGLIDSNNVIGAFPAEQRSHMIGLSSQPRQQTADNTPSVWASDESTGSRVRSDGKSEDSAGARWEGDALYRTLLLLASGIQMAGPNLTPETFEAGLQKTRFPNPEHPIKAGKVGFQGGSHAMTLDLVEYWWGATSPSPYRQDGPGTICYVREGARIRSGGYPRGGDPFYNGLCDSGR